MDGMVVSRSKQMLGYLQENKEYNESVLDEVKELVSAQEKIEKLLNNDGNSRKVMENMEKIRNLAYSIEDALETWAVKMELARMPNNNEKKRGILRCLDREYDDSNIMFFVMMLILMKCIFLADSLKWLHDTFPEDDLESEHSVVPERRMENHRSFRWPRPKYGRGVEEHFVEMKEEFDNLISLVAEDKHQIVSICGIKGLGKTTLARKVYIHPKVRSQFNAFAWVSLDQDHEIGTLLQDILNQLGAGAVKKSAEEQKKSAEDQRNRLQNMKNRGVGAVKRSEEEKKEVAEEQEKGVEENKKLAEIQREGAEEKIMEHRKGTEKMNEVTEEKKEVVEEKKKGTEEENEGTKEKKKGGEKMKEDEENYEAEDPKEGVKKKEKKKGAEEKRKGVEEQKEGEEEEKNECAEEEKEGLQEQKKGAEDHRKEAEEQKKGTEEKKEGAEEKKKGGKKLTMGNLLQNMRKLSAGSMKKSADEQINAAEEKKEGDGEQKEGGEEKKKGIEEKKRGAEEKQKGDEEKRKGAEEKNKGDMEKKGGPEERREGAEKNEKGIEEQNKGADKRKKGIEKKKKGAQEMKEGGEDKKKDTKESIIDIFLPTMKKLNAKVVKKKEGPEEKDNNAEEQQKSSEEEMLAQLKKTLRQKRCLVVIDGMSKLSQWTEISSLLVMEHTDTKFLLTTDDKTIASEGHSYSLRLLNEEEGWELLQKYVFRGKTAPEWGVVPILGKEMVRQCEYLPSKISSLGRTLSAMSLKDWHEVNDNVARYLQTDDQSTSNERSWDVVDPNYDHLSYSQKQRFLYLAIFKEDEDVDPEDLSFLWMGEGMVQHDKDKEGTVEKHGTIINTVKCYLQELHSEGMLNVKVDELSANMRFLPFSLHNHARQLSLYQGEKEDFRLKIVDFSGGKQPRFDPYTLSDGTRRFVIHFNKLSSSSSDMGGSTCLSTRAAAPVEEFFLKRMYFRRKGLNSGRGGGSEERNLNATYVLRSLLFVNSDREYVSLPVKISAFEEFTLLRVLHFVRCKFEDRKLPEGIWNLLNLRYFGLLYCDLGELPESIRNLRNLEVLNVRSYDDAIIAIANAISELTRLKHLRLPHNSDCEQYPHKLKLDGLVDLNTLVGFNSDKHDIGSLSKLKNLRYLGIHASSNDSLKSIINFGKSLKSNKSDDAGIRISLSVEYECDFISAEGSAILEELIICPNLDALTFSMVLIQNFPNCGAYASTDLTQIKFIACKLSEDPMEALGKFPNLRKLCLGYGAFVGKKMAISDKGFSKLEDLEFRCLPNLEEWIVDKGALQKLSTLTVKRSPKFKKIPEELEFVSSLKNMEIELEPSVDDNLLKKYQQMFAFVKSRNISKVDPLPAGSSSAH